VLLSICLLPAIGQLIVNEVSNGPTAGPNMEYVELVVTGTPTCTNYTTDISGWIFDDNNGQFGTGSMTGINQGHYRFPAIAQWQNIPIGSIIVIFNDAATQRNTSIPANDPTDANGDCVYILPGNSALLEKCDASPTTINPLYTGCTYSTATTLGWTTRVTFGNNNDAIQVRSSNAAAGPSHGVAYGPNNSLLSGTFPYFASGAGNSVINFLNTTNDNPNLQANWALSALSGTNQTPGAPNNAANAAWIESINYQCYPQTDTFNLTQYADTVCMGTSVTFSNYNGTWPGTFTWYDDLPSIGNVVATDTPNVVGPNTYWVKYTNGICEDSAMFTLVGKTIPGQAPGFYYTRNDTILRNTDSVCFFQTYTYYAPQIPGGATGYQWSAVYGNPVGTNISDTVRIAFGGPNPAYASLRLRIDNECGMALTTAPFAIWVTGRPTRPTTISGQNPICDTVDSILYVVPRIAPIYEVNNYIWTVTGGNITSGLGTDSIYVKWNTVGQGQICVRYENKCATSQQRCITYDVTAIFPDTVNRTICNGQSTNFGGMNYSSNGTYYDTIVAANGCDSVRVLFLNVVSQITSDTAVTICAGQTYFFDNMNIGTAGTYYDTLTAAGGCDSILELNLTVINGGSSNIDTMICQGDTFFVADTFYLMAGMYSDTIAAAGCDSVVNSNLTVNPSYYIIVDDTICDGDTLMFGGQSYTTSGLKFQNYTTANLCDSVYEIRLVVISSNPVNTNPTICTGQTYTVGSNNYTLSGMYSDTLTNSQGCDSIINTNLTVTSAIVNNISASICSGDTYPFGGMNLTMAGMYADTLTSNGCDSIINLTLTVTSSTDTNFFQTICEGDMVRGIALFNDTAFIDSFSVGGSFSSTQLFFDNLNAGAGNWNLNSNSVANGNDWVINSDYSSATCNFGGMPFFTLAAIPNQPAAIVGNPNSAYMHIVATEDGFCDAPWPPTSPSYFANGSPKNCTEMNVDVSTVGLINTNFSFWWLAVGLAGDSYGEVEYSTNSGATWTVVPASNLVGQSNWTQANFTNAAFNNQPTLRFRCCWTTGLGGTDPPLCLDDIEITADMAQQGCDSISTLNVTVNKDTSVTVNESICDNQTFPFNGSNLSVAGLYYDTLARANGCDSFITLNLTIDPTVAYNFGVNLCTGQSYQFGSLSITMAGTYYDTTLLSTGCDSVTTLTVTVSGFSGSTANEIICQGDSVLVGGQYYNQTGTIMDTVPGSSCDSIITTNITVNNNSSFSQSPSICAGQSLTVGFSVYNTSGNYSDTFMNAVGCDSIVTTMLTVTSSVPTTPNISICTGQSYMFGGNNLTTSGSYTDTFSASNGCDSIVNLMLNVNDTIYFAFDDSICQGQQYPFGGINYSMAGTYNDTLVSNAGCDSIVTLKLSIQTATTNNIQDSICQGSTYSFNTQMLTTAGIYRDTLAGSNCDSIVVLNLSVSAPISNQVNIAICTGQSYSFGSQNITSAGTYYDTTTAITNGCDSITELIVAVNAFSGSTLNLSACSGDSLLIGGNYYTAPGMYMDTLTGSTCDSIVTINLSSSTSVINNLSPTICQGQSFTVGSSTYSASGNYSDTLTSASGCDSIVNLNLTVSGLITTNLTDTACMGQPYTFGGNMIVSSGFYYDTLTSANNCDSIVILDLYMDPTSNPTLNVSICNGQSYAFGSQTITTAGTYYDTTTTALGCDSITTLMVAISNFSSSTTNISICQGDSILIGGIYYNTFGSFIDTVATTSCDSIITINITVNPISISNVSQTICNGDFVAIGPNIYNTTGNYSDTLQTANGCDSIINLSLTVNPVAVNNLSRSICPGGFVLVGSSIYTMSGMYSDTLTAPNGCDSIVNLTLTVAGTIVTNISNSICNGQTFTVGTSIYSMPGMYSDTLPSAGGCDSIVNLNLTISAAIVNTITDTICSGSWYSVNGRLYFVSGNYSDTIATLSGCDSIVNLNLFVTPPPINNITAAICTGSSFTVGSNSYSVSGNYTDTLNAGTNCDSIVNLNLMVVSSIINNITATICVGQTYTFGSANLGTSGMYSDTIVSVGGCDSIINLNLSVLSTIVNNLSQTICNGSSVIVGSSVYVATGNYSDTLMSSGGCDSVVNLNLTVNTSSLNPIAETICSGLSFTVGSSVYTASGVYFDTLTNVANCDSIVQLTLTVTGAAPNLVMANICNGQFYTVGTSVYTTSGFYQDTLTTAAGCDSLVNTALTVNPSASSSISDTICQGASYFFDGQFLMMAGLYNDTLVAANMCDSIVTLNLVVTQPVVTNVFDTICGNDSILMLGNYYSTTGIHIDTVTIAGCDSIVSLNLLAVNAPIANAGVDTSVCEGNMVNIGGFPTTTVGATVVWTASPAIGLTYLSDDSTANPTVTAPAGSGGSTITYTVTTMLNGCTSTSSVMVSISAKPVVNILGLDTLNTFCATDTPRILMATPAGGTFHINNGFALVNDEFDPNNYVGDSTYMVVYQHPGTAFNCGNSDTAFITLIGAPDPSFFAPVRVCLGDTAMIMYTGNSSATIRDYDWTFGGRTSFSSGFSAGPYFVAWNKVGTYTITLIVEDENGCRNNTSLTITVDAPSVQTIEDETILFGEDVRLFTNTVPILDSFLVYQWAATSPSLECYDCPHPLASPVKDTWYKILLTDSNGCTAEDSVLIKVFLDKASWIPNTFTPNGDGANDFAFLYGKGFERIEFSIYNRWGEKVFYTEDPSVGWDGNFKGNELNPSVFVYACKIWYRDGEEEVLRGNLTLIR